MTKASRSLESLLEALPDAEVNGVASVAVRGVTSDSRRVVPGMAFVAVAGTHDDGHRYVGEALERGASVIVGADASAHIGKRTFVRVSDPRLAVSRLAANWYGYPSRDLEIVGITGTNGKTSVAFMLRHLIQSHGDSCGLIGTVRYEVGNRHIPATRTTPDAVELQRLLAGMHAEGCRKVVMEVSSHALEQGRVADVEFDLAAFTNLTRDHLDYHLDMESYFTAKKLLFQMVEEGPSGRAMVVNVDDEYGRRLVSEIDGIRKVPFGLQDSRSVPYSAIGIRQHRTSTTFVSMVNQEPIEVELPMVGVHNVQNCLAAMALGGELGYEPASMASAVATLPAIPGRLERVDQGQPFAVFIDYAHTADALRRVLETLRRLSSGRLLLLFGCGGGRDQGKRREMGRIAAGLADQSWITNDNPRFEDPEAIVADIVEGIQIVGNHRWVVEYDRRRAIESIVSEASSNDVVLIAGKGHETYQEIDGSVIPFDDRLYTEKALENLGFAQSRVRLAS